LTEAIRRVGKKAQITLPKKMIDQLAITEGDRLLFRLSGKNIVITPVVPVSKSGLITENDLQEALAQADQEFADGSAKTFEEAGQLFKEAGWVEENNNS